MPKHIYETRVRAISGTKLPEVYKKAFALYQNIKKKTKRRPYVRSEFFKLELVQNTRVSPVSKENPFDRSQILHRFTGVTPEKELFRVQVKEEKDTKNKWLMSIFPINDV